MSEEINYKEELHKFIDYVLAEELPFEMSWNYATELKKRLERVEKND
jgi:hypothetical protein